jgi:hypothetical protein
MGNISLDDPVYYNGIPGNKVGEHRLVFNWLKIG